MSGTQQPVVVLLRFGTAAEAAAYVAPLAELFADADNRRLHLGDGVTPGGRPIPTFADLQARVPLWCGTAGGTPNALSVVAQPGAVALVAGMTLRFFPAVANTGPATLSVNGGAAQPLRTRAGVAFGAGELGPGSVVEATWTGSEWRADVGAFDRLPLTGGTLSGFLSLHAAPTAALHAATKGYVDTVAPTTTFTRTLLTAGDAATARTTLSVPPTPNSAGGLGTVQVLNPGIGNAVTLPAGGTWLWLAFTLSSGNALLAIAANVSAGGTQLAPAVAGQGYSVFVWRVA